MEIAAAEVSTGNRDSNPEYAAPLAMEKRPSSMEATRVRRRSHGSWRRVCCTKDQRFMLAQRGAACQASPQTASILPANRPVFRGDAGHIEASVNYRDVGKDDSYGA